jgi:O-acetyl-ADP-ribose deacetylase (regulator of RNase III)
MFKMPSPYLKNLSLQQRHYSTGLSDFDTNKIISGVLHTLNPLLSALDADLKQHNSVLSKIAYEIETMNNLHERNQSNYVLPPMFNLPLTVPPPTCPPQRMQMHADPISYHKMHVPQYPSSWRDPILKNNPDIFVPPPQDDWQLVRKGGRSQAQYNKYNVSTYNRFSALENKNVNNNVKNKFKMNHINGNLLDAESNTSIAHCVGADMTMGVGVAEQIREKYGHTTLLRSMNKSVGEIATLPISDQKYIFNMITKDSSRNDKPTLCNIEHCLQELRSLCENLGVQRLAMPRIASGHDQMSWHVIKQLIIRIFNSSDITIDIYHLPRKQLKQLKNSDPIITPPSPFNLKMSDFPELPNTQNIPHYKSSEKPRTNSPARLIPSPSEKNTIGTIFRLTPAAKITTPVPKSVDEEEVPELQLDFNRLLNLTQPPEDSDLDSSASTVGTDNGTDNIDVDNDSFVPPNKEPPHI